MAAKGHGRAGCDTNGYLRKKARCGRVGGHLPHYQSTLSQRECVGGVGLAPVINCLSVLLGICPSWACNTSRKASRALREGLQDLYDGAQVARQSDCHGGARANAASVKAPHVGVLPGAGSGVPTAAPAMDASSALSDGLQDIYNSAQDAHHCGAVGAHAKAALVGIPNDLWATLLQLQFLRCQHGWQLPRWVARQGSASTISLTACLLW